jgi:translation initiation factor 1
MAKRSAKDSALVYSTDRGRICPGCGHPADQCCCSKKSQPLGDGIVRISRETNGRKGTGVSLISGLRLDGAGLKRLAKQLKQKCGSGGSIKNGVIEIQGDHRDLLKAELEKQGYKAKLAGG